MGEMVKKWMDQAVWNYTSVLLAQPFEVAKTILQVHLATGGPGIVHPNPKVQRDQSGYGSSSGRRDEDGHGHGNGKGGRDGYGQDVRAESPILLRMNTPTGLTPGAPQSSYYQVSQPEAEEEVYQSDESDSDAPSYFTSSAPRSNSFSDNSPEYPTPAYSHASDYNYDGRHVPSRSHSTTPTPHSSRISAAPKDHKISLRRSDAILEVVSQLWQKEAAWGVWKGTNSTFIYNLLLRTLESWIRSVLAALINLPDSATLSLGAGGAGLAASAGAAATTSVAAAGLDILDSANPLATLGVAVAAAGITGLILSPLDIVRTRLIITPTSSQPRSIPPSIRQLPPYLSIQRVLGPITFLHSTIPSLFSNSAPLLLRSLFGIDPVITPGSYSVASFGAAVGELFVRLPLETVLRRGQVAVLHAESRRRVDVAKREQLHSFREGGRGRSREGSKSKAPADEELKTVVDVGPYRGVLGSMWFIVREEGVSVIGAPARAKAAVKGESAQSPRTRKGQGLKGLWRGWRVGMVGVLGVWGAAAMGSGPVGTEF